MNQPLVSIVTPVHNSGKFLVDSIESVLAQTYTNWELYLIDDFSSDDSPVLISSYSSEDSRITGIFLKKNFGAGFSRNVGLEQCKGEYIAFLDSDDVWLKDKLKLQVEFLELHSDIDFIHSWYDVIDELGEGDHHFTTPHKISYTLLRFNNYILTSTVVCRRNVLDGITFLQMRRRQDWAFFLDTLKKTRFAYALPKRLVQYRKSQNSLSANKFKLIKPNFLFFRDYFYAGNGFLAVLHFVIFLPFYFHNKVFNKKK